MGALVPELVVNFTLDGNQESVSYRDVPFMVWQELKRETGFTPKTLLEGLSEIDMDAIAGLLLLWSRCKGDKASWRDIVKRMDDIEEFELGEPDTGGVVPPSE